MMIVMVYVVLLRAGLLFKGSIVGGVLRLSSAPDAETCQFGQ
jgi:hypothetical protein